MISRMVLDEPMEKGAVGDLPHRGLDPTMGRIIISPGF